MLEVKEGVPTVVISKVKNDSEGKGAYWRMQTDNLESWGDLESVAAVVLANYLCDGVREGKGFDISAISSVLDRAAQMVASTYVDETKDIPAIITPSSQLELLP